MITKKLLNPKQHKGATKTGTSAEAHDTLTNRDKAEQHPKRYKRPTRHVR